MALFNICILSNCIKSYLMWYILRNSDVKLKITMRDLEPDGWKVSTSAPEEVRHAYQSKYKCVPINCIPIHRIFLYNLLCNINWYMCTHPVRTLIGTRVAPPLLLLYAHARPYSICILSNCIYLMWYILRNSDVKTQNYNEVDTRLYSR